MSRFTFLVHVDTDNDSVAERFLKTAGAVTFRRPGSGITTIRAEWREKPDSDSMVVRESVSTVRSLLGVLLGALKANHQLDSIERVTD